MSIRLPGVSDSQAGVAFFDKFLVLVFGLFQEPDKLLGCGFEFFL